MSGILICDDNPNIRQLLRVFVESQTEYKVCGEARNGTDCIERAKALRPDLILLDLSMPILNGAEAAALLKKMMPRTKIILFSLHFDSVPHHLAETAGVDLTLSKIDGITHLAGHLKALMPNGSHGSSTRAANDN